MATKIRVTEDEVLGESKKPPQKPPERKATPRLVRAKTEREDKPTATQAQRQKTAQEPLAVRCAKEIALVDRTIGDVKNRKMARGDKDRLDGELRNLRERLVILQNFDMRIAESGAKVPVRRTANLFEQLEEAFETTGKIYDRIITSYATESTKSLDDLDGYKIAYDRKIDIADRLFKRILAFQERNRRKSFNPALAFQDVYDREMAVLDELESAIMKYARNPVERDEKLEYIRRQRKEIQGAFTILRKEDLASFFDVKEDGGVVPRKDSKLMQMTSGPLLSAYFSGLLELVQKMYNEGTENRPERLRSAINMMEDLTRDRWNSLLYDTKVLVTDDTGKPKMKNGEPEMRDLLTKQETERLTGGFGARIEDVNIHSLKRVLTFLEQARKALNDGLRPRVTSEQIRDALSGVLKPGVNKEQVRKALNGLMIYDTLKLDISIEQVRKAVSSLIRPDATKEQIQKAFDGVLKPDLAYFEKNYAPVVRKHLDDAVSALYEADAEKAETIRKKMRPHLLSEQNKAVLASDKPRAQKIGELLKNIGKAYAKEIADYTIMSAGIVAALTGVAIAPAIALQIGYSGGTMGFKMSDEYKATRQISAGTIASSVILAATLIGAVGLTAMARTSASSLTSARMAETAREAAAVEEAFEKAAGKALTNIRRKQVYGLKDVIDADTARNIAHRKALEEAGVPPQEIGVPLTARNKVLAERAARAPAKTEGEAGETLKIWGEESAARIAEIDKALDAALKTLERNGVSQEARETIRGMLKGYSHLYKQKNYQQIVDKLAQISPEDLKTLASLREPPGWYVQEYILRSPENVENIKIILEKRRIIDGAGRPPTLDYASPRIDPADIFNKSFNEINAEIEAFNEAVKKQVQK